MATKIIPFHVWLRLFPKSTWQEIKDDLYSFGQLPESTQDDWRLVRIESGSGVKIGVIPAEAAPALSAMELLWLLQCRKAGDYDFYMKTTSGWAGKTTNVIRYYRVGHEFTTFLPEGLPARPND